MALIQTEIASGSAETAITRIEQQDIQPNAVDIKVTDIFQSLPDSAFEISPGHKKHRETTRVLTGEDEIGVFWYLPEGIYDCLSDSEINVAEGEAAWLITRSTLNRNGLRVTSGLYDSGFAGKIGFSLSVQGGPAKIYRRSRLAQLIISDAETAHKYNGDYGTGRMDSVLYS